MAFLVHNGKYGVYAWIIYPATGVKGNPVAETCCVQHTSIAALSVDCLVIFLLLAKNQAQRQFIPLQS